MSVQECLISGQIVQKAETCQGKAKKQKWGGGGCGLSDNLDIHRDFLNSCQ